MNVALSSTRSQQTLDALTAADVYDGVKFSDAGGRTRSVGPLAVRLDRVAARRLAYTGFLISAMRNLSFALGAAVGNGLIRSR